MWKQQGYLFPNKNENYAVINERLKKQTLPGRIFLKDIKKIFLSLSHKYRKQKISRLSI